MDSDYPIELPTGLLSNVASPEWMNKADNCWQLTAAAFVGLQSVPGLIILYGSIGKKKWAVNSAFMALYAFAAVLLCWVLWGYQMAFGEKFSPLSGVPNVALSQKFLLEEGPVGSVPTATYVFYQFAFAAITVILLAGSLLGRMNFYAWILFVPMWLTFSYTVGAYTLWGHGFLKNRGIDFSGGYVIHLSSGVAGFTAAYWAKRLYMQKATGYMSCKGSVNIERSRLINVINILVGPRLAHDRQHSPPNNIIHMLGGAGFLWLGWSGFNGGSPFSANMIASLAILNTHICTSVSLLVWLSLDIIVYKKSSVIGAVQGMITGLVCITPGAGVVEPWAAIVMGITSGSIPWYTMMVLHKRSAFFQKVDDPLGVFHTHAVAGLLGGLLSGVFAKTNYLQLYYGTHGKQGPGLVYSIVENKINKGIVQMGYQLMGAGFITVWNVLVTSIICIFISRIVNLRMDDDDLMIGDDAAHGEEAYALWGDGERLATPIRLAMNPKLPSFCRRRG